MKPFERKKPRSVAGVSVSVSIYYKRVAKTKIVKTEVV